MAMVFGAGGARFKKVIPVHLKFNPHWVGLFALGIPRYGAFAFVYNDYLYIVGGMGRAGVTSAVERINLIDLTRSYVAPMPEPRAFFGAGVISSKLYILGGIDRGSMPTNTIFVYDIPSNSWTTLTVTLPKKIAYCASAVLGNDIYIIGGLDDEGNILKDVYAFNTVNNTVTTKASLNVARQNHACATLNNMIYCFGGDDGSTSLSSIEVYDPSTNKWTLLDVTLPKPITGLTATTVKLENKDYILLIGG
jgi:Kelch motif.